MKNVLRLVGIYVGYLLLAIATLAVVAVVGIGFIMNSIATIATLAIAVIVTKVFLAPFNTGKKRLVFGGLVVVSVLGFFLPAVGSLLLSGFFTLWLKSAKRINQLRFVDKNPSVTISPVEVIQPLAIIPVETVQPVTVLPIEVIVVNQNLRIEQNHHVESALPENFIVIGDYPSDGYFEFERKNPTDS